MANILPKHKQVLCIKALIEGCSIRSTERMYDVHRDTIMRLMVRTGAHCIYLLDKHMQGIPAGEIECDEIWAFVGKKDKNLTIEEKKRGDLGSQFIWVAMDRNTKLVPSWLIGKREEVMAKRFMLDLSRRLNGTPTIVTDGLPAYRDAIEYAFGADVNFAQLIKVVKSLARPVREGYTPGNVVKCTKSILSGRVDKISTSLIERQNLTIRMSMRRLTRLTNAFSKKLENMKAAAALHFAFYNFCRIHSTIKTTPAMASGVVDELWEIDRLLPN